MATSAANFYPRSPCGERRESRQPCGHPTTYFYPRSPCGERLPLSGALCGLIIFLSTLSLRRATQIKQTCRAGTSISIHALLAESDERGREFLQELSHFYPRSPCGERLCILHHLQRQLFISIHALLAESDFHFSIFDFLDLSFLSTLSLRRATLMLIYTITAEDYFYPRSPCGERPDKS